MESQLRLTMVLGFGILIYSTRSYCGYFWYASLQHFHIFLLLTRKGSDHFRPSALSDTGEVGFGIPYMLYQKLLCLLLVCPSPTLSGISTLSQEGVKTP